MDISRTELVRLAVDTQRMFERGAVPHNLLMGLLMAQFPEYRQREEELCRGVQKTIRRFPRDNCMLASVMINHRLDQRGKVAEGLYLNTNKRISHIVVDAGIVEGERTIADITAHQFRRGPRLHVGPPLGIWVLLRDFAPISYPLPTHERHAS